MPHPGKGVGRWGELRSGELLYSFLEIETGGLFKVNIEYHFSQSVTDTMTVRTCEVAAISDTADVRYELEQFLGSQLAVHGFRAGIFDLVDSPSEVIGRENAGFTMQAVVLVGVGIEQLT